MSQLSVRNLIVKYGNVVAVDEVSFEAAEGEFIALLGPSGCGKTTTLRCIAGLEEASGGEIRIGDEVVVAEGREVPPERRGVNMVFQSYAVWPHMTVFDNVAYGLRTKRLPRDEIAGRVGETLRLVGLEGFGRRYGTELSGGQQQRVALARAIVTTPRLLLFDEPLSNLDAGLRERMRFELVELQRRLGRTSIYVTHDQAEAMVMSDRIILMDRGRIVQAGSPRELYERPASRFAAAFVGNANLLEGELSFGRGLLYPKFRVGELELVTRAAANGRLAGRSGSAAIACIRPESLRIVPEGTAGENVFTARVEQVSYLGATLHCRLRAGSVVLRAELPSHTAIATDSDAQVCLDPERIHLVPGESNRIN
jgi:ABC-type Fe3+/spermidine/putrescine transport system ATPase subunit